MIRLWSWRDHGCGRPGEMPCADEMRDVGGRTGAPALPAFRDGCFAGLDSVSLESNAEY